MLMRWLSQQIQPAREGFRQLRLTPFATLVTCLVIGMTLALPAAFQVALDNGTVLGDHLKETATLTVYLKKNAGAHGAQQLAHMLETHSGVGALQTISPAAGLRELEQQTGMDSPDAVLPDNPLPWVLIITPSSTGMTTAKLLALKQFIEKRPETDSVQLDREWVNQLTALLQTTHRIALALTTLLGIAVLFITGHSIWAVIGRHRLKIRIIRLTGGTAGFIRRPFLYAGALYGLAGGLIAWAAVSLLVQLLQEPVRQLGLMYHHAFSLTGLDASSVLLLLIGSALLGLSGAWLAVTGYLRLPEAANMAGSGEKC